MEKPKIAPLSADDVIAEAEKKIGKNRMSDNARIMIRILSEKALFMDELADELRDNPDYDSKGASDKQLKDRLVIMRRLNILGRQDGFYFIKGTMADPRIQDHAAKTEQFSDRKKKQRRSLRSIIYEILQKEPLPVNRLSERVKNHPDYHGSHGYGKRLVLAVNFKLNTAVNKKYFFERVDDRKKFCFWRVKPDSYPPPLESRQKIRPKQYALHRIMRKKALIRGWTYRDLYEEVIQPDSGYDENSESPPHLIMTCLSHVISNSRVGYFECVSLERPMRWRAVRLDGQLKIPSNQAEFRDLAFRVLDDLMLPLSLECLLKNIRQYGHLFGYKANELPLSFLRVEVTRAIVGTEYQNRIQEETF